LSQFEEGNATANINQIATTSPFEEDIIHSDLISDPAEDSSEEEIAEDSEETTEETEGSDIVPQIVDDGLDSNTRRSNRTRNPPKLLTFKYFQAARHWQEMKEIKTLIDAKTFALESSKDGEPVIPTMETNKVKIKSYGSLYKLKCRIVVRGDLQDTGMEDSWSPTAPFRSLKMFLADAARNRCRVHQLDFVGAFLQANVRGRIFVTLPKDY
jgi:hypothetical protein